MGRSQIHNMIIASRQPAIHYISRLSSTQSANVILNEVLETSFGLANYSMFVECCFYEIQIITGRQNAHSSTENRALSTKLLFVNFV